MADFGMADFVFVVIHGCQHDLYFIYRIETSAIRHHHIRHVGCSKKI